MLSSKQATTRPIKCLIGLFVSLVLCALLTGWATPAYADGPTISVGEAGEISPGGEFSVPVSIEGNTGIAGCALQIDYDSSALELVDFDTTGLLKGAIKNVEGGSVAYISISNITEDGELFKVRFKVRDGAAGGSYDISAALKGDAPSNIVDADANTVAVTFAAGSVQVPGGAGTGTGTDTGDNSGGNAGTGTDTGTGTGTDAGGTSGTGTGTVDTTPKTVTATDANGNTVQLELRGESGNLEYSLDKGSTWEKLPADGIIATEDGKSISVYGGGDADYYVQDLPEYMVPLAEAEQGISPVVWTIAAIAALLIIAAIVVAVVVMRRRKNARIDFGTESRAGAHSK